MELATGLASITEEMLPFLSQQVNADLTDLACKLMALYDIDLGLDSVEFQAFCVQVVRGLTRFNGLFPEEFTRFFVWQFRSHGVSLQDTIAFLRQAFEENGPEGSQWRFDRPNEKGEFQIRDLSRPTTHSIHRIAADNQTSQPTGWPYSSPGMSPGSQN